MAAHADLFAVCDAAFETARAVRVANKLARVRVVSNLIVDFRTRQTAGFRTCSNRDCLHCGYRHHRLREKPIELQVPRSVRTQSRYRSASDDFKNAAQRIPSLSR